MSEKLDIGEAISDAVQHIKTSWRALFVNYLFMLGIGLLTIAYATVVVYKKATTVTFTEYASPLDIMLESIIWMLPFMIFIGLIGICVQAVFIKIIDDTIEKRQMDYKAQLVFVLKRLGKLVLAGFIVIIPIVLMYLLMFKAITNMYYGSFAPFFLMLFIMLVYAMMLVFIDQSIITEEVSTFQAIKNSFVVVSHNFFRLLFTFIGYGILSYIIGQIFKDTHVVVVIMNAIINAFLSLFAVVFLTTLYKQVSERPTQDEAYELRYYEE